MTVRVDGYAGNQLNSLPLMGTPPWEVAFLLCEPLAGSGPEPRAQSHALASCLIAETIAVLIGDH